MIRYAYLPLLALLAVSVGACSTPEERAAEYMARANELFAEGELDKAGIEARNAVQIQPKNTEARYLLAQVAEKKGEVGQMLGHLAVVVEEDPTNEPAKVKLGTLLVYAQDYEGAGMLADDALKMKPDDPAAHVLKTRLQLQKKELPAALASIDKAIELDPQSLDGAALRAVILALQDADKALADLDASIARVGPKNAEPLRQLKVDMLSRLGRNDQVEKELRSLLTEFGGEKYHRNLSLLLIGQNRLDEAEQVLRDAVAADPKNVVTKVDLAQFQSKYRQQPEQAEKTLKQFIAEDPENQQLAVYLANFYEGGNRIPDALAAYERVAEQDANSTQGIEARNRIAALNLRAGDVAAAKDRLDGILEDEPDNVTALLTRGEINFVAGRNEDAIADFRGVLRRQPDNEIGLLLMARTHITVGDRPLAEDAYRRLLQLNPANGEALTGLARLVGENGQLEEAENLYQQALAADEKNASAIEGMIGVKLANGDFKGAEEQARTLAGFDDPEGIGQRELGRVLEAQRKWRPATEAYMKSLERKSNSTLALEGVARTMQEDNRLAEATEYLTAHLEQHPDHVMARVLLGGNLLRRGKLEEARAALNQAIDQKPDTSRAYMVLAAAYPDDPAQRIAVFQRGLDAVPTAGNLAVLLASEHQAAGRYDDAIKLYESVIKKNDDMPQVANNLAALLLDHRKDATSHKRALEIANRFANTQSPMYLDTLGWAHYRNKDYDAAIRYLELAVAYGRSEPEARFHLGMAYMAADNKVGAEQELQKALKEGNPKAPWVPQAKQALQTLSAAPAPKSAAGTG